MTGSGSRSAGARRCQARSRVHVDSFSDLPEDVVYKMTKTMATHVSDMAAVVKPITGLTPKDMAVDIGVPFHKGAEKYYKEVGAM